MAKQSGGNTAQRVEALVRPTVEGMGLRLWDVVFEKEGPDWYLRVLIDKTDGTTMDTDTCADVSHALDRANENGVKEFSGLLTSREGNTITLEGPAGPMQFELSAVSTVRLCDDEDLFD